jgi:isopentenyl phosphate kinase
MRGEAPARALPCPSPVVPHPLLSVLLVYLDPYHLGDPLFLQRFAPVVKAHEGPLVLVHGSGEAAEQMLEAQGRFVERVNGVLRVDETDRPLVERAARDLNRRIVEALGDAGVPAVRVAGSDRGLLRRTKEGHVEAGRADWLRTLIRQQVVPVVAALASDADGGIAEVAPGDVLAALARVLAEYVEVAVLLLAAGDEGADPEVVGRVRSEGVRVRLVGLQALRGRGLPDGVDLDAEPG